MKPNDGCCGVFYSLREEKVKFFAFSYDDYRVYIKDVEEPVEKIAEELDDFFGLHNTQLLNATGDEFSDRVIEALKTFQN